MKDILLNILLIGGIIIISPFVFTALLAIINMVLKLIVLFFKLILALFGTSVEIISKEDEDDANITDNA